ncbi:hypothetical protein Tco_0760368 [Tanacetum coccineum]
MQLKQEVFQNDESCVTQNAVEIPEYFEINDLKARLQDKDKTICKLKDTIKSLRENTKEQNVNHDKCELEPINKELENSVAKLLSENERLCNEINHVKQDYPDCTPGIWDSGGVFETHDWESLSDHELCQYIYGLENGLIMLHVSGSLCYPTNDYEDLGSWLNSASIHVTFDKLTAMAFEQFSSEPGLQYMTPATSCTGLVSDLFSDELVSTNRYDGSLFQPMFDEYFNPPTITNPELQTSNDRTVWFDAMQEEIYKFLLQGNQNQRDLPRDNPLVSVEVLRYNIKRSKSENKGIVPTEMELVLEQTQQGSSHDVSIVVMDLVIQYTTLLSYSSEDGNPARANIKQALRSDAYAGNPVKEILLNLNLPDHRSVLTDPQVHVKMEMEIPHSNKVKFITACSYSFDKYKDMMKAQIYVI